MKHKLSNDRDAIATPRTFEVAVARGDLRSVVRATSQSCRRSRSVRPDRVGGALATPHSRFERLTFSKAPGSAGEMDTTNSETQGDGDSDTAQTPITSG